MGLLIKMQSYKDYKDGLITKKQLLDGDTFLCEHKSIADLEFDRELDQAIAGLFDEVSEHNHQIGKVRDWKNAPHHRHCCCNKCAPTREALHRKVAAFNKEVEKRAQEKKEENLAPSDCEPE